NTDRRVPAMAPVLNIAEQRIIHPLQAKLFLLTPDIAKINKNCVSFIDHLLPVDTWCCRTKHGPKVRRQLKERQFALKGKQPVRLFSDAKVTKGPAEGHCWFGLWVGLLYRCQALLPLCQLFDKASGFGDAKTKCRQHDAHSMRYRDEGVEALDRCSG